MTTKTITVRTTPAAILRQSLELSEPQLGEGRWEAMARTLGELGYAIVPRNATQPTDEQLRDLERIHPVPWRVVTDHDVNTVWDDAGGDVVERRCSCGQRWTRDEETCPDDDGPRGVIDAVGDDVTLPGVETAVVAAVNAFVAGGRFDEIGQVTGR